MTLFQLTIVVWICTIVCVMGIHSHAGISGDRVTGMGLRVARPASAARRMAGDTACLGVARSIVQSERIDMRYLLALYVGLVVFVVVVGLHVAGGLAQLVAR